MAPFTEPETCVSVEAATLNSEPAGETQSVANTIQLARQLLESSLGYTCSV